MDDRTRTSLDEIADGYQKRLAELRKMQQDVQKVTATARTHDGLVSVEVGARGELRDIRFMLKDPAFHMLLAGAGAGRSWPPDVLSVAGMENMGLRSDITERAYDMLRSMANPQGPPPVPSPPPPPPPR